jgi:hypothetical protein
MYRRRSHHREPTGKATTMTTPDSLGSGGATTSGSGGLAAGPGDDQGEGAVTREAEEGGPARPGSTQNGAGTSAAAGGLSEGGGTGPDLTEDDEQSAQPE